VELETNSALPTFHELAQLSSAKFTLTEGLLLLDLTGEAHALSVDEVVGGSEGRKCDSLQVLLTTYEGNGL